MLKVIDTLARSGSSRLCRGCHVLRSVHLQFAMCTKCVARRPAPQAIVCASLAMSKMSPPRTLQVKTGADFSTLLKVGKCARVPSSWTSNCSFDEYKDGNGVTGYIAEVAFNGYPKHLYTIAATLPKLIDITWKEAFKDHSKALAWWFKSAKPTDWAQKKYELYACDAERVKTKFELRQGGQVLRGMGAPVHPGDFGILPFPEQK